jgi:hypothetical protein
LTAARTCLPRGLCTPKNCRYCLENLCIKRTTLCGWIQDSIVGVVTRLQSVWFLAGTSKFLLFWNVQTACRAIPVSDSFLWMLNSQDVKLTTDLHLVLGLQMSGALPLFPLYTLHPRRPDCCEKWYFCSV